MRCCLPMCHADGHYVIFGLSLCVDHYELALEEGGSDWAKMTTGALWEALIASEADDG